MTETATRRRLLEQADARAIIERLREPSAPPIRAIELHAVHRPDSGVVLSAWRVAFEDAAEGSFPDAFATLHQGPPWRIQRDQRHFESRADRTPSNGLQGCVLEGQETMAVAFPSDHRLRDLRWLQRPSHVLRLVTTSGLGEIQPGERFSKRRSQCTVLRYVPEQRAVLRWDLPVIDDATGAVLRVLSVHALVDGREPTLDPHIVALSLASARVDCPTILARPHAGVVLESTMPGRTWHGATGDAEALGAAVARLHGAVIPEGAPRHSVLEEMDRVLRACRLREAADPVLGRHAFAVADALAKHPPRPCPPAMLHGSLRPSRFRVGEHGPGLVGLSRAVVGSAAMDLASLQSDANWDSLDPAWLARFEQGYASVRPLPEPAPLRWFLAAAMVRTACRHGAEAGDRRTPDTCRWLDQARTLADRPPR